MKSKDLRAGVLYAMNERMSRIAPGYALPSDVTYEERREHSNWGEYKPRLRFIPTYKGSTGSTPSGLILCVVASRQNGEPFDHMADGMEAVTLEQALTSLSNRTTPGLPGTMRIEGYRPAQILMTWEEHLAKEAAEVVAKATSKAREEARAAKQIREADAIRAELTRRGFDLSGYQDPVSKYSNKVEFTFEQARQLLGMDAPAAD